MEVLVESFVFALIQVLKLLISTVLLKLNNLNIKSLASGSGGLLTDSLEFYVLDFFVLDVKDWFLDPNKRAFQRI